MGCFVFFEICFEQKIVSINTPLAHYHWQKTGILENKRLGQSVPFLESAFQFNQEPKMSFIDCSGRFLKLVLSG